MKIQYESFEFRADTLAVIESANTIIDEYEEKGFALTLRQVYYQFVARGLLANTEKNYKRLGSIINDARLAGLVDWNVITDRTRHIRALSHWRSPADIVDRAAEQYRIDKWQNQRTRIEVWVEKDALLDVVGQSCEPLDIPYFSCRGYVSQSEMWRASQRLIEYEGDGVQTLLLHLGDHDPSGLDMSRDIGSRLEGFGSKVEVRRIALTMEQVREINPPPNPAKTTDARFEAYRCEYGDESWELDALDPTFITNLIESEVFGERDVRKWNTMVRREKRERKALAAVVNELKDKFRSK